MTNKPKAVENYCKDCDNYPCILKAKREKCPSFRPKSKTAEDVLEEVYCDGQISGANSTAKTNYKDMPQVLSQLKELVPKKKDHTLFKYKEWTKFCKGYNQAIQDVNDKMFGGER
jgi:hypothetical protein